MEIFDVAVRRGDGDVTVALRGELDLNGTALLDERMRPLTGQYDADQIAIDCTGLDFIDLQGLRAMVKIARINRHTGRMHLRGASELLLQTLELLDLAETFEIDSEDAAVA